MKPSVPYIFLATLLALAACRSDKDRMGEIVEEWQGKEIILPDDMTFSVQGDTVYYDVDDCDYKILCYVDSGGCSTCKMNLIGWEQFMGEIDSNQDVSVNLIMIVNTEHPEDLTKRIKQYHFNYPIAIDDNNLVGSKNRFPEDILYHTLLLNDENKVIVLGNPLLDPNIKRLYEKELGIDSINHDLSEIKVSPKHLAMGAFTSAEEKKVKFRLFNNGSKTVTIQDISTSCSCTTAWTDNDTIYPNGNIDINVNCQPEKGDSHFVRYINVLLNDNQEINLSISGFMEIEN